MRILLSFILIFLLSNCRDMNPEEYKNTEPKIKIEEYFLGPIGQQNQEDLSFVFWI